MKNYITSYINVGLRSVFFLAFAGLLVAHLLYKNKAFDGFYLFYFFSNPFYHFFIVYLLGSLAIFFVRLLPELDNNKIIKTGLVLLKFFLISGILTSVLSTLMVCVLLSLGILGKTDSEFICIIIGDCNIRNHFLFITVVLSSFFYLISTILSIIVCLSCLFKLVKNNSLGRNIWYILAFVFISFSSFRHILSLFLTTIIQFYYTNIEIPFLPQIYGFQHNFGLRLSIGSESNILNSNLMDDYVPFSPILIILIFYEKYLRNVKSLFLAFLPALFFVITILNCISCCNFFYCQYYLLTPKYGGSYIGLDLSVYWSFFNLLVLNTIFHQLIFFNGQTLKNKLFYIHLGLLTLVFCFVLVYPFFKDYVVLELKSEFIYRLRNAVIAFFIFTQFLLNWNYRLSLKT